MERAPVTGGLVLPNAIGISDSEQKKLHEQWSTIELVEADLYSKGFTAIEAPTFEPPIIDGDLLTTADLKFYSDVYAKQLHWFNYAAEILSPIKARILEVENEMSLIESKMRKSFRDAMKNGGAKMTVEEMKDEIRLDPRYMALLKYEQELKQKKEELGTFVDRIERGLKVISRQVEIKKMEVERTMVNIPNRGYGLPRQPNPLMNPTPSYRGGEDEG